MFEQLKSELEKINPKLIKSAIDIYERNIRIGFPEDLCILGLFLPYLDAGTSEEKKSTKNIIKKYLEFADEKIKNIETIFDIECFANESIKEAYKKNPFKIYDIIFTKITLIDVALAIMSYKINQINIKDYYPDSQTFLHFIEHCYSPMSQIFGISVYTNLFDDFVITNKFPEEYKKVLELTKYDLTRTKKEIDDIITNLKKYQKHNNEIFKGRVKSASSVFKKIYVRKEKIEDILDFVAIRIVTNSISDCYSWLGIIYELYNPRLSKFKDYIEHPKPNGYKSLHITIDTDKGPVEIQIRTHNMHRFAEFGIAAHWKYKTKSSNKKLERIKTTIETQNPNFGSNYIYVFTPKNDIILLDNGSSIIDFAYSIHTELGDHLESAEVNGNIVALETKLKDNDKVKIYTNEKKRPSKKWLEYVVTGKAKEKICQTLNIVRKDKREKIKNNEKIETKISVANCCKPFVNDDVGLFKTTKRKLILHKISCLEKNNMKYSLASDELKNHFLLEKEIKIILDKNQTNSGNIENYIEILKSKFNLHNIYYCANEFKNCITFDTKLKSKEEFNKLKEQLLEEDYIDSIELI